MEVLLNLAHKMPDSFWNNFNGATKGTVYRNILYKDPINDNENVLVALKYQLAEVDFYYHVGNEWVLVLDGYQETFNHQKYDSIQPDFFRRIKNDIFKYILKEGGLLTKPGTGHCVRSNDCLAVVFYEKLPEFPRK